MPREMLYTADEIFLTGTATEVTPVRSVDRIKVGTGKRGPITKQIQRTFLDLVHGKGSRTARLAHARARGAGEREVATRRQPPPTRCYLTAFVLRNGRPDPVRRPARSTR